jgi:hypothetical protein
VIPFAADAASTCAGILLDGLGGALIGAAATITVVVATIVHERHMRTADVLDDAIATAYAAALAHGMTTKVHGASSKQSIDSAQQMLQAVTVAFSRAQSIEPELAELLRKASDDASAAMHSIANDRATWDAYEASLFRLQTTIGQWIARPDLIRQHSLTYDHIQQIAEAANADGSPMPDLGIKNPNAWARLRRRLRRHG